MRRVLVALSVLCGALAAPVAAAPPADAATAEACTWSMVEAYTAQLLPPLTQPPTTYNIPISTAFAMTCVVGGSTWNFTGQGVTMGGCAAEVGRSDMVGENSYGEHLAMAMAWARVGVYGWAFIIMASPSGTQYLVEGPLGWQPQNLTDCVSTGVGAASMTGVGPMVGL